QNVQRDLVRGLLSAGSFDQRDHAVDKALARFLSNLHDDSVRQHSRTTSHRTAVAAALPDHWRALARNRALIDASDAIDDVTVARNHVSGLADHPIARPEVRRWDWLLGPVEHGGIDEPTSDGVGLGAAQRLGLRLPAALGDSFREVGE